MAASDYPVDSRDAVRNQKITQPGVGPRWRPKRIQKCMKEDEESETKSETDTKTDSEGETIDATAEKVENK